MRFLLKIVRVAAWLLVVLITVLSVVPPSLRPETGAPHNLEHFAIFAVAGFAFGLGYSHRSVWIIVALAVFATAIELAQIVIPGRHARFEDFVIDAAAVCVSAAAAAFFASRVFGQNV